jgi:hypothetical protein
VYLYLYINVFCIAFDVDNADEAKQTVLRQFLTDTGAEEVNVKSI